ncbi:hypothetical protein CB0940_05967 [Cercospora beticola]|uniref:Uncharacterized protein n=1 Tax=Cercospora beticola TaxID=122368 RepID=A0A2G5HXI3_CERBT|nr:hypothetical protein CB0940_05967 [Cercospora beticola]PIA97230.1 hypothetical protein CB0940_05967 [Cercospora beticola]WPA98568.1 hypothetical protein RHO25_003180 [Cercospora beticola]CAK1359829.1 unnamed protein product [Cercospora beticola]
MAIRLRLLPPQPPRVNDIASTPTTLKAKGKEPCKVCLDENRICSAVEQGEYPCEACVDDAHRAAACYPSSEGQDPTTEQPTSFKETFKAKIPATKPSQAASAADYEPRQAAGQVQAIENGAQDIKATRGSPDYGAIAAAATKAHADATTNIMLPGSHSLRNRGFHIPVKKQRADQQDY